MGMVNHLIMLELISMWCIPYLNFQSLFKASLPGQYGHHFTDDIFQYIFFSERFCILIQISLKFVPNEPIDNKVALIQLMTWHQTGNKPLSEPMLTVNWRIYAALGGDEFKVEFKLVLFTDFQYCG